jgi:hypothetical protein
MPTHRGPQSWCAVGSEEPVLLAQAAGVARRPGLLPATAGGLTPKSVAVRSFYGRHREPHFLTLVSASTAFWLHTDIREPAHESDHAPLYRFRHAE